VNVVAVVEIAVPVAAAAVEYLQGMHITPESLMQFNLFLKKLGTRGEKTIIASTTTTQRFIG
jgi:hypothetical protein